MNDINDKITEYLQSANITAKDCKLNFNPDCRFYITSETLDNEIIIKTTKEIGKIETS